MTLPSSPLQRRTTDSARSRRARCTAANRLAATELHRAAERAQAVLAEGAAASVPEPAAHATDREPRAAGQDRTATTRAASARSARAADAVVAQWLLEQSPRRGARLAAA